MTNDKNELVLRDILANLTFLQAAKLLGPEGRRLLSKSSSLTDNLDLETAIHLGDASLVVDLAEARVTVTPTAEPNRRLALRCSACQSPENNCEHIV
ncbi:MAG: hypothetical protein LBU79_01010, partial [Planctomycetota bacterium]|nr:hypothetical protein [Planctomycetota bacterium]